jgi:hypothetical protein
MHTLTGRKVGLQQPRASMIPEHVGVPARTPATRAGKGLELVAIENRLMLSSVNLAPIHDLGAEPEEAGSI